MHTLTKSRCPECDGVCWASSQAAISKSETNHRLFEVFYARREQERAKERAERAKKAEEMAAQVDELQFDETLLGDTWD